MAGDLQFKEQFAEGTAIVQLIGEVDIMTSQSLKEKLYSLVDTYKSDLKLECERLDYIDSTGLGVLVSALKKAKQYGKNIYLVNLKDNIRKLFVITGLDKVFIIEGKNND